MDTSSNSRLNQTIVSTRSATSSGNHSDAIINDIGMAMRDVGLTFPLYITVRNSGDALGTIATPIDPSDEEWQQANGNRLSDSRREGWLCSVARTRTCLRYCERRGDKCCRCNRRLIRSCRHSFIVYPKQAATVRWGGFSWRPRDTTLAAFWSHLRRSRVPRQW